MMSLEEIVKHVEQVAYSNNDKALICMGIKEYRQLAELLRELQERRKAPEIITCGECELKLVCCRTIRSEGRKNDDFCSCGIREERRTE